MTRSPVRNPVTDWDEEKRMRRLHDLRGYRVIARHLGVSTATLRKRANDIARYDPRAISAHPITGRLTASADRLSLWKRQA